MAKQTILISVWDKSGLVEFLGALKKKTELRLIATGSTGDYLKENGFACEAVSDITQFPEILDGRVKTLHPKVFGGILAKDTPEHRETLEAHQIPEIDMVICNLYPFEAKLIENLPEDKMIEFIDIGGVSLLRAAAKNFSRVAICSQQVHYSLVLEQFNNNEVPRPLRKQLAQEAFAQTTRYDAAISGYLTQGSEKSVFPQTIQQTFHKVQDLRYGENPQDAGAWYNTSPSELPFTCLQGKELSYNNLLDIHAAYHLVREFGDAPACCIIKH